jgi:competence protein ComEA
VAERDKWQLLAWAVAAALVVLVAVRLLAPGGGQGAQPAPAVRVDDSDGVPRGGNRAHGAGLYVHVAGAVRRPGLVRVPSGSRVATALRRAGGPLRRADLTAVNLASKLEDGQQVVVPVVGSAPAAAAAVASPGASLGRGAARAAGAGAPAISLATATVEQLDSLDGIGPTLARRIVEQRQRAGGFRSLEELREVDGIGDKRFEALKAALRP